MHGVLGMAKKPPPPPPPPPSKGKKAPPPPPKKTPPPPPPKKKTPPPPPKKKAPPKKAPPAKKPTKSPPPKKRRRPSKDAKQKAPSKKPAKKSRKIRIKLGLRQSRIRDESDEVVPEDIGWTMSQEDFDDFEEPESNEPEIVSHQCSMCGSIMQIPAPKRDRYEVHCAYPECGHVDKFGI